MEYKNLVKLQLPQNTTERAGVFPWVAEKSSKDDSSKEKWSRKIGRKENWSRGKLVERKIGSRSRGKLVERKIGREEVWSKGRMVGGKLVEKTRKIGE